MAIGDRLKEIRGKLLQEEFGRIFGVYKGTVANYERGTRKPDSEYLNKILEYFPDINPTWLLTGQGPKRQEKTGVQPATQMIAKNASDQEISNDPLSILFLRDWCDLSDVGKLRVWTSLKEELQKEKGAIQ